MNNISISQSYSNYLRISPSKIRRIADQIRYFSYEEAMSVLNFLPNRACSIIKKCLVSSVFNLRSRSNVDFSLIYVKSIVVNVGPVIKRFRPRAQGRAFSIKKRMSHLINLI